MVRFAPGISRMNHHMIFVVYGPKLDMASFGTACLMCHITGQPSWFDHTGYTI